MKYLIATFLLLIFLTQCKKETKQPEVHIKSDIRDNFIGTYSVISETPNYIFTISKVDSMQQQWFKIKNICNLFDMVFVAQQDYTPKNFLGFPTYFPIIDKFNNRWDFGVYSNDSIRNVNLIVNDTFRLYYRIQNTPWHIDDDTTYFNKKFLMVAVRNK